MVITNHSINCDKGRNIKRQKFLQHGEPAWGLREDLPKDVTFKRRPEGLTDLLPLAEAAQVTGALQASVSTSVKWGSWGASVTGSVLGLQCGDTAKPRPDGVKCSADMSYDITLQKDWEPDGPL